MQVTRPTVQEPKKKINKEIKTRYGRFSFIQNIEEVEDGEYKVKVGFKVPRTFNDVKLDKVYYKHIEIDNVATVRASYADNSLRLQHPDREEVSERVDNHLKNIRKKLEKRLVSVIGEELVDLPGVKNDFSKVRRLLRVLREENRTDFSTFKSENDNVDRYLDLLVSLNYLEEENGVYTETDHLKELYDDNGNSAYKKVIQDIITNRLEHVKEFSLSNVLPYIRILETYYFVAYQTRDDLEVNISQMQKYYRRQHNKSMSREKMLDKLYNLVEVGVLEREEDFFKSNRQITDRVMEGTPTNA